MDNQTLVKEQIDDGQKLLQQLRETGFDVAAGFWALTTDDARWIFYIASAEVDAQGLAAAFRVVNNVRARAHCLWIPGSDVRLISSNDPMATDAVSFGSDRFATRFGGRKLGGLIIESAYIYPMSGVSVHSASE